MNLYAVQKKSNGQLIAVVWAVNAKHARVKVRRAFRAPHLQVNVEVAWNQEKIAA